MTTLAWDGNEFAADKAATDDVGQFPVTKVFRIKESKFGDIIYGLAGDYEVCLSVGAWLAGGPFPNTIFDMDRQGVGFFVDSMGGIYDITNKLTPVPVEAKMYSAGAGGTAALSAMIAGQTARQAIETAAKIDSLSSHHGIDVCRFDDNDKLSPILETMIKHMRIIHDSHKQWTADKE